MLKMEQNNLPVIAKKLWSIVRVAFFMLRKGISKRKLLLDLNMMMKRGKLASKALSNLMFHHHHHHGASASAAAQREYEFSCSNTPNYPFHLMGGKRRSHHSNHFFKCAHAPATQEDDVAAMNAVKAVLEILNNHEVVAAVEASPMPTPFQTPSLLPGFGRSPMVRQLRITDSPFPLRETDEDSHVDKAAEEFIERFYKNLRQQKQK
ncbi:PREDICTED: uncharacterized protein LOC101306150 [Fragaria vesca subsp. vesca]|uniref:uncharacterized protein LOC101306150 n=1 Tax=Fragaria vesca subsp. vesca TaxID=101020 RepID=UPI0002C32F2A|nr:PREDICTED: uncharacterized protein LOC101306150 [Fragaria vesca subsp. vesca]